MEAEITMLAAREGPSGTKALGVGIRAKSEFPWASDGWVAGCRSVEVATRIPLRLAPVDNLNLRRLDYRVAEISTDSYVERHAFIGASLRILPPPSAALSIDCVGAIAPHVPDHKAEDGSFRAKRIII